MKSKRTKFHKIQNSNLEWVEYPEEVFYEKDKTNKNNTMLVVSNILKNQPQLVQELKELYGPEVAGIMERWIRIEVERDADGSIIFYKSIVHNCTPPIIKEGFTHSLIFVSNDKNYLEFIKWDINKKLKERQSLNNLDISFRKDEISEISDNVQPSDIVIEKTYSSLNDLLKYLKLIDSYNSNNKIKKYLKLVGSYNNINILFKKLKLHFIVEKILKIN